MRLVRLLSIAILLSACSDSSPDVPIGDGDGDGDGDFGGTPGGVQDMSLARELIAEGIVPPADAFVVEGMFSEHELGLEGPPCATLLCVRSGIGFAPDLDGTDAGWFQLGLSSTIDPDSFQRPSLTIIATVDVSGSMGWDYGDETPAAISVELLESIADQLGEGDRLAIVTYGSDVRTALDLTDGADRSRIQQAIDALDEGGSTNMEAGMERAYQLASGAVGVTDETRIILFTDAQPNVGNTDVSTFEQLASSGADEGVGLTVLGLGLGLSAELFEAMSTMRGGNAFSLQAQADVASHMEDNWPWMVSPIAYDLSLTVETTATVGEAYGFPGDDSASLEVATVFLSKRKGALLLRLDDPAIGEGFSVDVDLSYVEVGGPMRGDALSSQFDPSAGLDERGHYFEQDSVGKTTALAILVSAMKDAAEQYGASQAAAVEIMTAATERITADAASLGDPALDPEVALSQALLDLMIDGAEQGDLYGGY